MDGNSFKALRIGNTLKYTAGYESNHIEAAVRVDGKPGLTGVYVRILEIFEQGEESLCVEGDRILAGVAELNPLSSRELEL